MTAAQIAEILALALSTVSLWLKRIGLGKRSRLEPPEPPNRYERRHPGELVHVDIKQLGRISRAAPAIASSATARARSTPHRGPQARADPLRIRPRDGRRPQPAGLRRGPADADRALRDRGSCAERSPGSPSAASRVQRSHERQRLRLRRAQPTATRSRELGLRQLRIRPYRPRTNGKAERFIQTLLNEWAYERVYGNSAERAAALPLFLERYNFRRPHGSLGHQPPASRLTNLVRNYS